MQQPDTADDFALDLVDTLANEDVASLARMYHRYLIEEFDRTGRRAAGAPYGLGLMALFLRLDGDAAGFITLDIGARTVELLYVEAPYRRKGLATAALDSLTRPLPELLAAREPLTPAGEAFTVRYGLPVVEPEGGQHAATQGDLAAWEEGLRKECRHAFRSRPAGRPCQSCYRTALVDYVDARVVMQAAGIRRNLLD